MAYRSDDGGTLGIAARIQRLNVERVRLRPRDVMIELRAVRGGAQAAGLEAVAALAHALERELLAYGDEAPVVAYLDRMHDAVEVESGAEHRFVELALATVGTRLALA